MNIINYVMICIHESRKEIFILFTVIWCWTYGTEPLRNIQPLLYQVGFFWLAARLGFFYVHHPTDRIAHTIAFVTPVVEHWLKQKIAQWATVMGEHILSHCGTYHERCYHSCIKYVVFIQLVVEHLLMVRWVIGTIFHGEPIKLFPVPASAPRLV